MGLIDDDAAANGPPGDLKFATPTILIVNRRGHTTTVSGLTDAFSIEQAIGEARSG